MTFPRYYRKKRIEVRCIEPVILSSEMAESDIEFVIVPIVREHEKEDEEE